MRASILKKITIGVLYALSINHANAVVTVIKEHDIVDQSALAKFSQVGLSGEKASIINGYGEDMPFNIALDIIIPNDWNSSFNNGAELYNVNWEGNVSWPYVLKNMSQKNNISISINWEKKHVDLFSHTAHSEVLTQQKEMQELVDLVSAEQSAIKNQYLLKKEKELREKFELENKITEEKLQSQQDAELASTKYIKKLEDDKILLIQEKEKAENNLNNMQEITTNNLNNTGITLSELTINDLTNKEIANNVESQFTNIDLKSLKTEYDSKTVLPLEYSFEFYIKGGYEQTFDYYTPATFIAKRGYTLQQVIESWADSIEWELMWDTSTHYSIDYDMQFEGIMKEASTSLILLYKDAKRPLDIEYYPDQKLIVVSDLEFK